MRRYINGYHKTVTPPVMPRNHKCDQCGKARRQGSCNRCHECLTAWRQRFNEPQETGGQSCTEADEAKMIAPGYRRSKTSNSRRNGYDPAHSDIVYHG